MSEHMEENPQVDLRRLQELLDEKDPPWRASDLAFYSKLNYNTVYAITTGRRSNPQADTLNAIATALKVTPDYLLGRSDYRNPPKEKLPEHIRQLVNVASKLSIARQEELIRIAEALEEMERKQPVYTVSEEAMNSLLEILNAAQSEDVNEETYLLLDDLRRAALPRFLDFRPRKDGGESAQH